jgi:hypothetical protein
VLELANKLELSSDQRASVQTLFDDMKAEAVPLGAKLPNRPKMTRLIRSGHSVAGGPS